LPRQLSLPLGYLHIVLVHGSPRRVNEYLYEDRPDNSLERLLDLAEAEILGCGHTHIPYHRILPSGRHVGNVGSVGKPKDGDPKACYAVLETDGGDLRVQFIRVPYDIEAAVDAFEASEMPDVCPNAACGKRLIAHASRLMSRDEHMLTCVHQADAMADAFGISTTVVGELYFAVNASQRWTHNMERLLRLLANLYIYPF
jgi:diadenosine tetraphosphatase ApaH/serine/threonine PP2A family protein phosphatase